MEKGKYLQRHVGTSIFRCTRINAELIYLDLAGSNTEGDYMFIF